MLGLSDLTGELMRFAIAAIAQRGGRQKASDVCSFVRDCRAGESVCWMHFLEPRRLRLRGLSDFEALTPYFRDLRKKQHVTTQSLEKIEDGWYITVRSG